VRALRPLQMSFWKGFLSLDLRSESGRSSKAASSDRLSRQSSIRASCRRRIASLFEPFLSAIALQSSMLVRVKNVSVAVAPLIPDRSSSKAIERTMSRSSRSRVTAKRNNASNQSLALVLSFSRFSYIAADPLNGNCVAYGGVCRASNHVVRMEVIYLRQHGRHGRARLFAQSNQWQPDFGRH
jgi:hypothetical protein